MIHNHWLRITLLDSQSPAQYSTPWCTTICSVEHTHDTKPLAHQKSTLLVVHSGVLSWASCCEPWFVMLSQRVLIMVCYSVPVGVNHGELYWASGCESCCIMLSQWLWNMLCYADLFVGNQVVLCWASGCESWWVMMSQWLWIMLIFVPLAQNNTPWFTITCSV
jgi:hypothetical protein